MRVRPLALALVVAMMAVVPLTVTAQRVEAQGTTNQVVANYLDRTGVSWKRNAKDSNEFIVTKTTGLKRADRVELYVYNDAKEAEVRIRAYPMTGGKYLALAQAGDQTGLMKAMLQRNATAFGAYFVDKEGDVGFKYVFTTESGVGYESFKVVINELLRIADDAVVALYAQYR